jgi:actin cytoskeleton-regulatory complex protein SLA1
MPFVDVCRAVYDYAPTSAEELEIKEGDLLLVIEKSSEDDWWKCKRKAVNEDDDEPEGLVPNNYVEKVQRSKQARALYDYGHQTDEELSFEEGARLDVYDESDPDWTLVGKGGEYGFAPAIYIEAAAGGAAPAPAAPTPAPAPAAVVSPPRAQRELAPPPMPSRPTAADEPIPGEADYPDPGQGPTPEPEPSAPNPAAALAGIIAQKTGGAQPSPTSDRGLVSPPLPRRPQYTPEESEGEEPPPRMPTRPKSQVLPSPPPTQQVSPRIAEPPGVMNSPPYNRVASGSWNGANEEEALRSPGGFHLYNIHEMVSHMGKNKKMPTTLGINLAKGIIMISPEKSRDGPSQEWTAEKLTHYSIEGKHVFIDLVRPSKSVDFHAGAKDTAQEIVSQLGELAGAVRQEGLKEVLAASAGSGAAGQKKGKMLYEFMAQGEDEVTVAVDDEVIILDDRASEEWWKVRRLKNGKEGVVPSSYVEITGTIPRALDSISGLNAARSTVEQNRLEEERLAKEAAKKNKHKDGDVPERKSSLPEDSDKKSSQKRASKDQPKSKPNQARVRTWTDRSGTFKVEAEFIGLRDGKIHLHKQNGVKIAVPVSKMAVEDLEYVERATGASLDDDKPLSDIRRRSTQKKREAERSNGSRGTGAGASVQPSKDEYDWFDFFLQCGVNPQICERYASAFARDQMSPEVLPEVNEQLLRTLGLKEGDILRVMKFLDNKYDRKRTVIGGAAGYGAQEDDKIESANGGLFSGPGGALRNNTRKGRPAPAIQTNDVVSEDAFRQKIESPAAKDISADARATPLTSAPARQAKVGFDDDAWDVKPARTQAAAAAAAPAPASAPAEPPKPVEPPKPQLNDDLALLALPLQPERTGAAPTQPVATQTTAAPAPAPAAQSPVAPQQPQQPQGADQALFEKIAALAPPRQRPQPPVQQAAATGLAPPPRAASAPGFNPQQPGGQFGPPPLQPQLTGYQPQQPIYAQPTGFQPPPVPQINGLQAFPQAAQVPQPSGIQAVQQNFPALQPQPTGMAFQPQSQFGQQQAMQQYPQQTGFQQPQPTGFMSQQPQPSYQQAIVNGAQTGSPFADPPRQPFQPAPSGLSNTFSPQQTGFPAPQAQPSFNISQPTGFGVNGVNGFQPQPAPRLPPQQTGGVFGPSQPLTPLVPQKTGPPPPVRFGVTGGSILVPQPTGRANLAKASKSCFVIFLWHMLSC